MSNKFQARVANKNDIAENWAKAENFQPLKGEIIIYNKDEETLAPKMKIGDGVTKVNDLPFFRGDCIGEETEEGGILLHEIGTNQALAKNTLAAGNDNWAGYYGYKILYISDTDYSNTLVDVWVNDLDLPKASECYSIGDIVQMHLSSHYHDRYIITDFSEFLWDSELKRLVTVITLKPTYGNEVTDNLNLVSDENNTAGTRNWLYVLGKPYGEPMKYSYGATVFGNHNTVTGQGALVAGNYNEVPGHAAIVGGSENRVGYAGFASGVANQPLHNRSAAMGYGLKSGRVNQVLAGMYNEIEENAMFVVGGGTGNANSTRKTIFKVENNGDIYGKRDLKVEGEIQYKDVNLTEKMKDVDYQLASPDRYKIVDELPDSSEVTNYSDMYLVKQNDGYSKYIYGDTNISNIESSNVWDGTLVEPIKNSKGQYIIDTAEKLAYAIYNGGTIGEETGCHFVITKDIYLNDINKINWATGTVTSGYSAKKWYSETTEAGQKVGAKFNGVIDGGYHTIHGIYIPYKWSYSPPTSSNTAAGFIPSTASGSNVVIKNLNINNSFIKVRGYAGGIIGATYGKTTIENCSVGKNVALGGYSAAAIRGAGRSDHSSVVIANCYSLSETLIADSGGNLPTAYGLCGYFWDDNAEITSSFNAAGPIVSNNYTKLRIKDCYTIKDEIGIEGITILSQDNMQGLDVLTNPNKMPLLEKLHMFKATESYPTYKFATFGWIKIDEATKEIHNPLLDLINYELMEDDTIKILGYKNYDYNSIVGEHIIPDTIDGYPVTVIGQGAFDHCYGLTKIVLPNSLRVIEDYAFQNTSLTEVIFPEGLQVIGVNAFGLSQLSYVDLPNSVQEVANGAFDATPTKFINLGQSITKMPDIDNVNITEFIISDSITELGALTTCAKLKTVIVGKGVTTIPNNFLRYSHEVKNIVLPNNIVTIGDEAFIFSGLETITIPTSVATMGNNAFTGTSLTDIYYEGTEEQWNNIVIGADEQNKIANATIHFNQAPATKDYVETQLNTPKAEMILTDNTTGVNYRIYISDGKLNMEVAE